jgi:hypothetical protein
MADHVGPALGDAHPRVHDRGPGAIQGLEVARFGGDRRRHRREVGNQLGVLRSHRLDHDGAGAADDRAPAVVRQQLAVLSGDQLVAQHAAVHDLVTSGVTGVYDLLRCGRVEVRRGLDAQD